MSPRGPTDSERDDRGPGGWFERVQLGVGVLLLSLGAAAVILVFTLDGTVGERLIRFAVATILGIYGIRKIRFARAK